MHQSTSLLSLHKGLHSSATLADSAHGTNESQCFPTICHPDPRASLRGHTADLTYTAQHPGSAGCQPDKLERMMAAANQLGLFSIRSRRGPVEPVYRNNTASSMLKDSHPNNIKSLVFALITTKSQLL